MSAEREQGGSMLQCKVKNAGNNCTIVILIIMLIGVFLKVCCVSGAVLRT